MPAGSPPSPSYVEAENSYWPFDDRSSFGIAEFLYKTEEMSAGNINELLNLLAERYKDEDPPFADHQDLYSAIDAIKEGDIPWESFSVSYSGDLPDDVSNVAPWKLKQYEVWFRDPLAVIENQIANKTFDGKIDYAPKHVYRNGKRQYQDFMTGNWAWRQAVSVNVSLFEFYSNIITRTKLGVETVPCTVTAVHRTVC